MRALQEKNFQQLQAVGGEIQGHVFPYPFYFGRVLDLELAQREHADQRSLRFDNYGGMTVVELTGNYFGSYSVELVNKSRRALRTFQDVMLPILEIAVAGPKDNPDVEGFAMEISHHIRGQTMGMNMEHPENLVLVLPKAAAVRLVSARMRPTARLPFSMSSFSSTASRSFFISATGPPRQLLKQQERSDPDVNSSAGNPPAMFDLGGRQGLGSGERRDAQQQSGGQPNITSSR